jgi:hypothetical protein
MAEGKKRRSPGVERERRGSPIERDEKRPAELKWTLAAGANWENVEEESPHGALHIGPEEIPEGFDLQWVTDSVYGQPFARHRASFEKSGWTPVHNKDFDARFAGRFMPKSQEGEIKMDGLVLMARPLELSLKAKRKERQVAESKVAAMKDSRLRGNIPGVSLDARHRTALASNVIASEYEAITIPD